MSLKLSLVFLVLIPLLSSDLMINAKLTGKKEKKTGERGPSSVLTMKKVQKLAGLLIALDAGSIELNLRQYRELIFDIPRNHTAFVLFYNKEDICALCNEVVHKFDEIADAFASRNVDFDQSTSIWNLQVSAFFVKIRMSRDVRHMLVELDPSRPSLYYFAPSNSSKYNEFERFQQEYFISESGTLNFRNTLRWIKELSGIQITLGKEKDGGYDPTTASILISVAVFGMMILFNVYLFGYWDALVEAVSLCNYSYTLIVIITWLVSGQMYNYIRYTPMMGSGGLSLASFIYPGTRNQYGIESIIIMILYGLIIYGVIQLIETREQQLSEGLPSSSVQNSVMSALSYLFFGYMILQFISQIKLHR